MVFLNIDKPKSCSECPLKYQKIDYDNVSPGIYFVCTLLGKPVPFTTSCNYFCPLIDEKEYKENK